MKLGAVVGLTGGKSEKVLAGARREVAVELELHVTLRCVDGHRHVQKGAYRSRGTTSAKET